MARLSSIGDMSDNLALFGEHETGRPGRPPLAETLRPKTWAEVQGLEELDKSLAQQLSAGRGTPPSLILWGPPGSGKTTMAKLIGASFDCRFVQISAVLSGVKEIREVVEEAKKSPKRTILFVDEIHRFNRGQQDAFLPHVENGTLILIGATTENPSFYLNSALLSRARVVPLKPLDPKNLISILARGRDHLGLKISNEALELIAGAADGDGRRALNILESANQALGGGKDEIPASKLNEFLRDSKSLFYDRSGEEHYNTVSAFIKSMRGSDPDAALFWCFKMIESGDDPRFVIRRMIIFAAEDIGNADPRALQLAVSTLSAFEALGLPEGKIPIAQCIVYLAAAPKSNRSYSAMKKIISEVHRCSAAKVPAHLRNAPTALMESMGYGEGYRYPHDEAQGYAPGVQYLPDELKGQKFYEPSDRGLEKNIAERLSFLASMAKAK